MQANANPFDASGYIIDRAMKESERAGELRSKGIYRIDGRRYHKFTSSEGSVYLPGDGEVPELHGEFAVCQAHLALKTEVLKVRDGLPIDVKIRERQAEIIALLRKCIAGKIKGPTVTIETRSGAVLELQTKPTKEGKSTSTE